MCAQRRLGSAGTKAGIPCLRSEAALSNGLLQLEWAQRMPITCQDRHISFLTKTSGVYWQSYRIQKGNHHLCHTKFTMITLFGTEVIKSYILSKPQITRVVCKFLRQSPFCQKDGTSFKTAYVVIKSHCCH